MRQKAIQDYQYQVYLIQGVRKDSEEPGNRFQWVPFSGLRFSLQYLFTDSLSRGKIFERHFLKYLQLRFVTYARQYQESSTAILPEVRLVNASLVLDT